MQFKDVVTDPAEFRELMGTPPPPCVAKTLLRLDRHCRAFIARSPFVLIASANARGQMDISPKGDAPGFVRVLDDRTVTVPDRPGNRRADTFTNVLENPKVGLIFLVPGKSETLRVSGSAQNRSGCRSARVDGGSRQDTGLRPGGRGRRGVLSLLEMHRPFEPVEPGFLAIARWSAKSCSDDGGCRRASDAG